MNTQAHHFASYLNYIAKAVPSHLHSPENTALVKRLLNEYSDLFDVERPQATQTVFVGSNDEYVTIEFKDHTSLVFKDSGIYLTTSLNTSDKTTSKQHQVLNLRGAQ